MFALSKEPCGRKKIQPCWIKPIYHYVVVRLRSLELSFATTVQMSGTINQGCLLTF